MRKLFCQVPSVNTVQFQSLLKSCMQPVLKALVLRCQMPKYRRRPQNCSEIVFEQYDRFCPSSSHCLCPPRLSSVHTLSVRDRTIPHYNTTPNYNITPHNTTVHPYLVYRGAFFATPPNSSPEQNTAQYRTVLLASTKFCFKAHLRRTRYLYCVSCFTRLSLSDLGKRRNQLNIDINI